MKKAPRLRVAALCLLTSLTASAFPYIVREGDTLAKLAERFYGKLPYERVIVAANRLDIGGSMKMEPGMLLEIPALSFYRVAKDDTWKTIATRFLGDEDRAVFLSENNGSHPWLEPELGRVIRLPFHLSISLTGQESLSTLSYRFLGGTKHAFALSQYNGLKDGKLQKGDILMIPLTDLPLTPEAQTLAKDAARRLVAEAEGDATGRSRAAQKGLEELAAMVRSGRYVSAVALYGERLTLAELSEAEKARALLLLTEAYVALDALGLAKTSCARYREINPEADFDPVQTSPKILAACEPVTPTTGSSPHDRTLQAKP